MAIRNVGGHGVTSMLNGSHHTVANGSQPNFSVSPGMTAYNGAKGGSGGNFPGARKTKVPANAGIQGQTGVSWAQGAGKNP